MTNYQLRDILLMIKNKQNTNRADGRINVYYNYNYYYFVPKSESSVALMAVQTILI